MKKKIMKMKSGVKIMKASINNQRKIMKIIISITSKIIAAKENNESVMAA